MSAHRLVVLLLPVTLLLGCADDGGADDLPTFTSGGASGTGTGSETGDATTTTGDGDGDGDPSGDGDPTTGDGDGDGDPTTTTGDGDGDPGCETIPGDAGTSCGQEAGIKGSVAFGGSITDLPVGGILASDNGLGNGAEDWYRFEFPLDPNNPRPAAGTITLDFAVNQGGDYRFELYRDCGAQAYGQGLAAEFGSNAPPLLEWTFGDLDAGVEQLDYLDMVPWPETVWVRVFRVQNANACSNYQLQVTRN